MKEQIKKDIAEHLEQNDNGEVPPPILWDACKAVLRGKIIGYSAYLKRVRQKELIQLEAELTQLENFTKTQMIKKNKIESYLGRKRTK